MQIRAFWFFLTINLLAIACGDKPGQKFVIAVPNSDHAEHNYYFTTAADDGNTLTFGSSPHDTKTVTTYAGQLRLEEDAVLWQNDELTTQIGTVDQDNRIHLCGEAGFTDCTAAIAIKPGDHRHQKPIVSLHLEWAPSHLTTAPDNDTRETSLIPYTLPSPNQDEAGTCLFMATTGAAEILLNRLNKQTYQPELMDGRTDLSERFLMNASSRHSLTNWRTDTVELYNREGGALLNQTYRYTKGWFKYRNQRTVAAKPGDANAEYGTQFNWVDHYSKSLQKQLVPMPTLSRRLLFVDPDHNQWNVGIMNDRVVDKIKDTLSSRKEPVILIYNHHGYWHAVVIVGYDDEAPSNGCPFVDTFVSTMENENPEAAQKVKKAMKRQGGCDSRGVFYVRDSIYTGTTEPQYDYDLGQRGDERPYSKRLITLSYSWAKYLGNHAFAISADR